MSSEDKFLACPFFTVYYFSLMQKKHCKCGKMYLSNKSLILYYEVNKKKQIQFSRPCEQLLDFRILAIFIVFAKKLKRAY
jgi:hypothetical protein